MRLQRLSDLKFFSGWFEAATTSEARIRLRPTKAPLALGDKFSLEIHGIDRVATFHGQLRDVRGWIGDFRVLSGIEFKEKVETARISLFGYQGRLTIEAEEHSFNVLDICEWGLGIALSQDIPRGKEIKFELYTPYGPISGTAEIRYCRTDVDAPSQMRAGLSLMPLNRIDKARWHQVISSVASAVA